MNNSTDNKTKYRKVILPALIVFVIVNAVCIFWRVQLQERKIDVAVIQAGNTILFLISILASYMHLKAVGNKNPHAFVRSVMGATVIKLFVIAGSILIYLFLAGKEKNIAGVFICMGLYIVYTIIEVKGAFKLNQDKSNGKN